MASWEDSSGRKDGSSEYKFGDYTRSLVKWVNESQSNNGGNEEEEEEASSWKSLSGRTEGPEGYKFGDLTSSTLNFIFGGFTLSPKQNNAEPATTTVDRNNLSAEERKAAALKKVEESKKRARKAKIQPLQDRFKNAALAVLSGKTISPEQLDLLWDVSKELTAEEAAEVLVPLLQQMRSKSSSNDATVTSDPAVKASLADIIDIVLCGKDITQEQISLISEYATKLSPEDVMAVVSSVLLTSWSKKEAAKQIERTERGELKTAFANSVREYLASPPGQADQQSFLMLLSASQLLSQKTVAQILTEQHTSWEALNRMQSVEKSQDSEVFVAQAANRQARSPGWKPPPPPPRTRIASSTSTSPPPPPPAPRTATAIATATAASVPVPSSTISPTADTATAPETRRHSLPSSLLMDVVNAKLASLKKVEVDPNSTSATSSACGSSASSSMPSSMQKALVEKINRLRAVIQPKEDDADEEEESDGDDEWLQQK